MPKKSLVSIPPFMFRIVGQKREVQTFNGLATLFGQFRSNPTFLLQPSNLMAARTAEVLHQRQALLLLLWIIEKARRWVGSVGFLQGDEVACNVLSFLHREAQVGHYGHLLDL